MESTYSLKAEELPDDFVDYVRGFYKGKFISITISDEDETDFLLRDADTREKLIKSTQNVENRRESR